MTRYFVVLSLIICLVAWTDATRGDLCDNFDGYTTCQPPVPPWQEFYHGSGPNPPVYTRQEAAAAGVIIHVDDTVRYGASGKSVHFSDASGGMGSQLYQTFAPASSVTVDYYMLTSDVQKSGVFGMLYYGSGGHWPDFGIDYAVVFSNGADGGQAGRIGIWSNSGWVTTDLLGAAYEADTWYHVRRVLDCTTDTGSFFVEKADGSVQSPVYPLGRLYPYSYVSGMRFETGYSGGADCYIDELTITSAAAPVPEPASLTMGIIGIVWVGGYLRKYLPRKRWDQK